MKKCDKKQLTLWVAGVLDPEQARACEAHVAQCSECRKNHSALMAIVSDFGSHAASLPPINDVAKLHRSLDRRVREETDASSNMFWLRKGLMPIAASAAALLAAIFLTWSNFKNHSSVSLSPQLVRVQPVAPKNPEATLTPTLSNYSSASRRSLEEFERALDAQVKVKAFRSHAVDSEISLNGLL